MVPERHTPTPPADVAATHRSGAVRPTFRDHVLQEEIDRFGYTLGPPLEPDVLAAVRDAHRRIGHAPDDPQISLNWSFHSRSREHKDLVKREMMRLVGPYLDALLVDHVPYLATFITKWPGPSSGFAPHQDPTLVDERHYRGITIWIPLTATTAADGVDAGSLHVVPGSHRFSTAPRIQDVDAFEYAAHEVAILEDHGRAIPMEAGEVLVFDNRVIHYSWPNETDEPRVVLSFTVRPRETTAVLLRSRGPGEVDLFEIHDDFYLDVLPAEQNAWVPDAPPAATLPRRVEAIDAARFDELCRAVGPAPHVAMPAVRARPRAMDPPPFCHLCGSADGLDDMDRSGRNNAQLVCPSCRAALEGRAPSPTASEP